MVNPVYVYGIDLAADLNFFALYILRIENGRVYVERIRKARNCLYPELEALVLSFIKKYPPLKIYTDYTNEKSFSQWLEAHLNPAFANKNSPQHGKWKFVEPVIFSINSKQNMKNNARQMFSDMIFAWPKPEKTHPKTQALIVETKQQMERERMVTTSANKATFPKPKGKDNDLVMALELALLGARKYIGHMGGGVGSPEAIGLKMLHEPISPQEDLTNRLKNRFKGFDVTDMEINFPS